MAIPSEKTVNVALPQFILFRYTGIKNPDGSDGMEQVAVSPIMQGIRAAIRDHKVINYRIAVQVIVEDQPPGLTFIQ